MASIYVKRINFKPLGIANAWEMSCFLLSQSNRTIKYVTLGMTAYNTVGDVVLSYRNKDEVMGYRYTGPLNPGQGVWIDMGKIFNVSSLGYIDLECALVEYMDGTEEWLESKDLAENVDYENDNSSDEIYSNNENISEPEPEPEPETENIGWGIVGVFFILALIFWFMDGFWTLVSIFFGFATIGGVMNILQKNKM